MKNKRLLDIMGEIDDRHIACAAPAEKQSRKPAWIRWGAAAACLAPALIIAAALLAQLGTTLNNPDSTITPPDNQGGVIEGNPPSDNRIDIDIGGFNGRVDVMYDRGYESVEELLEVATLIVRATPVSVEHESAVALCWVLRVDKANKKGIEVIRLRQLKDEYLLKEGQEVVLALQEDAGEGDYYIPGGGSGLFRVDEETGAISGPLMGSLKKHAPSAAELTLSDVFDILTDMSKK